MQLIKKNEIAPGLVWIEIEKADLYLCCGCPPDTTKFLRKKSPLNRKKAKRSANAILISDLVTHKGRIRNFAEFPLMDMLYNQEMINGVDGQSEKPIVIGLKEVVDQQVNYTCRGNYGYFSKEEILESGISEKEAERYMQLKLWFASHGIHKADELFNRLYLGDIEIEIKNGVTIKRKNPDQFVIQYKNESCLVDLSIGDKEPPLPFKLRDFDTELNSFSVMHSGEGNGWNDKNPCMGSIIIHEGRIYAVDTGPGFANIINHLGLDIQDIDGVFLTHNHDDHFAGLTDLLKSSHQVNFFASKLVRLTVQKKFAELLGVNESAFHHFFKVHDLIFDKWNDVEGLDVKPIFTPHPVETNAFIFRKIKAGSEKVYTHLADTISFENFKKFLQENKLQFPDGEKEFDKLKAHYLTPSHLKKIDIGGGIIHGLKSDFSDDKSEHLVFSHTDKPGIRVNGVEKKKASFGEQHVFFSGHEWDYYYPVFKSILKNNFPDISDEIVKQIYGKTRLIKKKRGQKVKLEGSKVLVVMCGNICENNVRFTDKILFDRHHILGLDELFTYTDADLVVNTSYMKAIEIGKEFFLSKLSPLKSWKEYLAKKDMLRVISGSKLFSHFSCSHTKLRMTENAAVKVCTEERFFKEDQLNNLWIVKRGAVSCIREGYKRFTLHEGDFFGARGLINYGMNNVEFQAEAGTILVKIPENTFKNIPLIIWMVYENCTYLDHICKVKGQSIKHAGKDS